MTGDLSLWLTQLWQSASEVGRQWASHIDQWSRDPELRQKLETATHFSLRWIVPPTLVLGALYLVSFGAVIAGIVTLAVGFGALLYKNENLSPLKSRAVVAAAVASYVLVFNSGAQTAHYNFSTEGCVSNSAHPARGDVQSLDDPRLSARDRSWIKNMMAVHLQEPATNVPIDELALANILVHARVVTWALQWNAELNPGRGGVDAAKEAYAARYFDRRHACALYGLGDRRASNALQDAKSQAIRLQTDQAIYTILPLIRKTHPDRRPPLSRNG